MNTKTLAFRISVVIVLVTGLLLGIYACAKKAPAEPNTRPPVVQPTTDPLTEPVVASEEIPGQWWWENGGIDLDGDGFFDYIPEDVNLDGTITEDDVDYDAVMQKMVELGVVDPSEWEYMENGYPDTPAEFFDDYTKVEGAPEDDAWLQDFYQVEPDSLWTTIDPQSAPAFEATAVAAFRSALICKDRQTGAINNVVWDTPIPGCALNEAVKTQLGEWISPDYTFEEYPTGVVVEKITSNIDTISYQMSAGVKILEETNAGPSVSGSVTLTGTVMLDAEKYIVDFTVG